MVQAEEIKSQAKRICKEDEIGKNEPLLGEDFYLMTIFFDVVLFGKYSGA